MVRGGVHEEGFAVLCLLPAGPELRLKQRSRHGLADGVSGEMKKVWNGSGREREWATIWGACAEERDHDKEERLREVMSESMLRWDILRLKSGEC
ncbi:hypothetical protein NDU88_003735 [Pleurodeles waltl]|uniref:Uncharacterized protein n=1 Tax=Pleurodeles waltl TaxID=8319 RepID=A0AAV7TP70_PLEWA|nr:hypothetical protein NDU88_003735 [Pleurodeles waltl]